MNIVKLKFKSKGFREILTSGGVQSAVGSAAAAIQSKANANAPASAGGFSCKTWSGKYGGGRWVASVSTTDFASRVAESKDKALSRAVGGGK